MSKPQLILILIRALHVKGILPSYSPKHIPAPTQVIKACWELRSEPSPGISLVPSLTDTTQPPGRTDHRGLSPTLQSAATENSRKTQRHLPSSDYSGRRQEFRQHLQVIIHYVSPTKLGHLIKVGYSWFGQNITRSPPLYHSQDTPKSHTEKYQLQENHAPAGFHSNYKITNGKKTREEGRRGIRRKKILTGMPFLVKAVERQREWKERCQ